MKTELSDVSCFGSFLAMHGEILTAEECFAKRAAAAPTRRIPPGCARARPPRLIPSQKQRFSLGSSRLATSDRNAHFPRSASAKLRLFYQFRFADEVRNVTNLH